MYSERLDYQEKRKYNCLIILNLCVFSIIFHSRSEMSLRKLAAICWVLAVLNCVPPEGFCVGFAQLYRQGLDAEDAGKLDEAVGFYTDALKLQPNSAHVYAKRGEALLRKNDPAAAIKDLQQAVKLDPGYSAAFSRLGFAYNAINDYEKALEALNIAILLDPTSSEAYNTRGFAHNGKNEFEQGIKDFEKAIRLNSNDARYYNNRGFAHNGRHDYEKAIEDFNKAIQLDAGKAMFYNNRGVAYMRKKDFDKALEDFDKTLKIDSNFSSAYHNRGMALSGKGKHEKALEEFSKVIEMNPNSPVLYKDRGTAYRKLGEYELAIKDFEKSIDLDKKFAPAYAALALIYATADKPSFRNSALAQKYIEKAVGLSKGEGPDIIQVLAEVQYSQGNVQAAVNTMKKALALDTTNKEYLELLTKWQSEVPKMTEQHAEEKTDRFKTLW
jgi:tetratricopeptide (TPR) repeat protein